MNDVDDRVLIALNPVRADRADDFLAWLATVVAPAVREHRPEQDGRWQVLRAAEPEDGVITFAFLFKGGAPQEWELLPVLEAALGVQGAAQAMADVEAMMHSDQYGWSFRAVQLAVT